MKINFGIDGAYHTTRLDGTEYPRVNAVQHDMSAANSYGENDEFKWILIIDGTDYKSFYQMELTYKWNSELELIDK